MEECCGETLRGGAGSRLGEGALDLSDAEIGVDGALPSFRIGPRSTVELSRGCTLGRVLWAPMNEPGGAAGA